MLRGSWAPYSTTSSSAALMVHVLWSSSNIHSHCPPISRNTNTLSLAQASQISHETRHFTTLIFSRFSGPVFDKPLQPKFLVDYHVLRPLFFRLMVGR